ncbi:hypothetical protein YC2023_031662 [Brassica napus]
MPCVFIGYSSTQSAYLCLQPHTGRVYVSRDVRFDESTFPFKTNLKPTPTSTTPAEPPPPTYPLATTIPIPLQPQPPPNPIPPVPLVEQTGTPSLTLTRQFRFAFSKCGGFLYCISLTGSLHYDGFFCLSTSAITITTTSTDQ